MPELPEVEVVKQELEKLLRGEIIKEAKIYFSGAVGYPETDEFMRLIKGKKIKQLTRKGKYLTLNLSGNFRLIVHFRMTGTLKYENSGHSTPSRHVRIVLYLESGRSIYFIDQRKFGKMWLLQPGEDRCSGIEQLGPDWWNEASLPLFKERLASRGNSRLKPLLLDQKFMSGLGNIYVDESLYRARLHPSCRARYLGESKKEELFQIIRRTLEEGIEHGGTTIRDYRHANGNIGGYQEMLQVYRKQGGACKNCHQVIKRISLGGRGTFFCPGCQQDVED